MKNKQTLMRVDEQLLNELHKLKRKKHNNRMESYGEVIRRLLKQGGAKRLLREKEELLR